MVVFADTSALLALLDAGEANHEAIAAAWDTLVVRDRLVTTNYVVVETASLCQRRLGTALTHGFLRGVVPLIEVRWMNEEIHDRAVEALLAVGRRPLSLVDCASFALMREQGIERAFTLDRHFAEQGFECIP